MTKPLRGSWAVAWRQLPADVHEAFSDATRFPFKATQAGVFPHVFAHIPAALRSYRAVVGLNPAIDDDVADALVAEVALAADTLATAARYRRWCEELRAGDELGFDNPREPLSRFVAQLALQPRTLEREEVEELFDAAFRRAPVTVAVMRRGLRDPEVSDPVEKRLAAATPYAVRPETEETHAEREHLNGLLRELLDSQRVASMRSRDADAVGAEERRLWREIVAHPALDDAHRWCRGVGLAWALPVPVPPLQVQRGEMLSPPRRLDRSIALRLRGALSDRNDRLPADGLPRVLEAEVDRAVDALGLATPAARGLVALATMVFVGMDQQRPADGGPAAAAAPRTLTAERFGRSMAAFEEARRRTAGYARLGQDVRQQIEDPGPAFVDELWGRVHGHEVRGSRDFADAAQALTQFAGVRETRFRRLAALTRAPRRWETSDDEEAGHDPGFRAVEAGRTATLTALNELLRDAVEVLLTRLDEAGQQTLREFMTSASADAPTHRRRWDRWNSSWLHQPALTYDIVIALLDAYWREEPVGDPTDP